MRWIGLASVLAIFVLPGLVLGGPPVIGPYGTCCGGGGYGLSAPACCGGGYTATAPLAPGCCETQRPCCEHIWDGFCQEKAWLRGHCGKHYGCCTRRFGCIGMMEAGGCCGGVAYEQPAEPAPGAKLTVPVPGGARASPPGGPTPVPVEQSPAPAAAPSASPSDAVAPPAKATTPASPKPAPVPPKPTPSPAGKATWRPLDYFPR